MKKLIGTEKKILFENPKLSYTDDYFKVLVYEKNRSFSSLNGTLVRVKLKGLVKNVFSAEILQ